MRLSQAIVALTILKADLAVQKGIDDSVAYTEIIVSPREIKLKRAGKVLTIPLVEMG